MKILIIEDEQTLLEILSSQLKEKSWQVISASEGSDALEKIKEKPDIVVLDILIPGIDGIQVLTEIRKQYNNKQMPVIVLSNFSDLEYIEKTKKLGISVYLVKGNVDTQEIIAEIEKISNLKKINE